MSRPQHSDSPLQLGLIAVRGFCMGAADVVPGVSGGTMAFILGIYQRLLRAIAAFDLELVGLLLRGRPGLALRHVDAGFLAALLAGIFAALMFFTRVVPLPRLIETHPELVYGLFFGLIVGSVGVLSLELGRWRAADLACAGGGLVAGLLVVNLVPVQTPDDTWFIVLAGALAITAMILPGISGSFILLILQKYAYVFDAIGRLDLAIVVPFAAGCGLGLLAFSRVLSWLLEHHYRITMTVIIGVLVGSLWRIWPFQERIYATVRGKQRLMDSTPVLPASVDTTLLYAVALAVAGVGLVWLVQWLAVRNRVRHGGA